MRREGRRLYHGPINLGSAVRSAGGGWMDGTFLLWAGRDGMGIFCAHRKRREQHTLATTSYYFLEREMGKRERNRCGGKEQRVIPPLVWLWPVDLDGLVLVWWW